MGSDPAHVLINALGFAAIIYSIVLHEIAHGWVALKCGDVTAHHQGRLTLNPIPHIDPIMSIVVPLIAFLGTGAPFGAAKPVPVNPKNFRHYKRDTILVSLAGVTTNFLIAVACTGVIHLCYHLGRTENVLFAVCAKTMFWNLGLACFNLIPVPPFDGSRVFRFVLDLETRWKYDKLEPYGLWIVIVAMRVVPQLGDVVFWPVKLYVNSVFPDELVLHVVRAIFRG